MTPPRPRKLVSVVKDEHLPPKQEVLPITRKVLAKVVKAPDLEVHTCEANMGGVTVLDIRDYVPSTGLYGRGTTLPWNTETLKVLEAALKEARRA